MSYRYRKYFPQCKDIDCGGKPSQKRCPDIPLKQNGIPKACGAWIAELRDDDGKWVQTSLENSNKTEAREYFQILLGKRADGVLKLKKKGVPTLRAYCNTYLEHTKTTMKETTYLNHERAVKALSRHLIGDYRLDDITSFKIEKYRVDRKLAGIKASSINADMTILKSILTTARREGIIRDNPMEGLKRLLTEQSDKRCLTDAEIQLLLQNTTGRDRVLVLLSLFTGLRLQDCLSLKWENIDFQKGVISLTVSKTGRKELLPVCDNLANALQDYRNRDGQTDMQDALFYGGKINQVIRSRESLHFVRYFKKMGIPNFSFHGLRHTHATLISETSSLAVASKMLGHATQQMTLNYVHVDSKEKREAVERLSDRIFSAGKTILFNQKSAIHST